MNGLRIHRFDKTKTFSTMSEAVSEANMDWEVAARPILDDETNLPIPNQVNIKRMEKDDTLPTHRMSLGIHKSTYEVIQNTQLFAPFDPFLESGKVRIESIGEMNQGKVLFAQAQILGKEEVSVGGDGQDKINPYITCVNSHDGTKAFGINENKIRIICENTLRMATGVTGSILKVVHRKGASEKVVGVIDILTQLTQSWDVQMDLAAKLRDKKLSSPELERFMRKFMGVEDSAVLKGKTKTNLDSLMNAALNSPGNSPTDVNLWSAYNGATYNLTHLGGKADNRAFDNLFGVKADKNQSAWRQALEFAGLAA